MKNHYQTLGVTETASDEEIRSAYRRLLQESLTDKDRFDAVKEAFEAVRTPEKRAEYDRYLAGKPVVDPAEIARRTGTARLARRPAETERTGSLAIPVPCPVCGHRNQAGDAYCGECGFLLASPADAISPLQETADITRQPHLTDDNGKIYVLRPGVNTVGRETGDIVLPDKTVSRHHAHIVYDEDRGLYSVEDIDSTNGTSVNGQRLLPRIPHPVLPGDDIMFGSIPVRLVAHERTAILPVVQEPEPTVNSVVSEELAQLNLVRGTGPEEVTIVNGANTIGRMPDNRVCIRNDRYISGHHANIDADRRVFRLIDLGSTNGTFLNGLRLTTNEAIAISEGDEITIGGTVYVFTRDVSKQKPLAESLSDDKTSQMEISEASA